MPTYILLSTLTGQGARTLHSNPDRMTEVNREVDGFGCRIVSQYALLGGYDFLTVVEAPDNETVAHLSADMASRGTVRITTLPAVPVDDLVKKMKAPHKMGHG